ncbi:YkgJ family cysteine cluster protein, partial [Nanoarchaeota archaeon]
VLNFKFNKIINQTAIIVDEMYKNVDDEIEKEISRIKKDLDVHVSCKKNCHYCCCNPMSVSLIDSIRIYKYLQNKEDIKEKFLKNYEEWIINVNPRSFDLMRNNNLDINVDKYDRGIDRLCPFLDEKSCSVYYVRPKECRDYFVSNDPELCGDVNNDEVTKINPIIFRKTKEKYPIINRALLKQLDLPDIRFSLPVAVYKLIENQNSFYDKVRKDWTSVYD